jgi:hypothetical protein
VQVIDREQRTVGDPVAPSEYALHAGQQQAPEEELLTEHRVEDANTMSIATVFEPLIATDIEPPSATN